MFLPGELGSLHNTRVAIRIVATTQIAPLQTIFLVARESGEYQRTIHPVCNFNSESKRLTPRII